MNQFSLSMPETSSIVQNFARMGANRIVESIKLETSIGNCALNISAAIRNDKMSVLGLEAMKYLVWHKGQSVAFKKDSGFTNKSAYSESLSNHLVSVLKTVLGVCFQDIEVKTALEVKQSPVDRLAKQFIDLGYSADDAKALAEKTIANSPKTTKSETKVEAPVEEEIAA